MKKAVGCGSWNLFRFKPQGCCRQFSLDSRSPRAVIRSSDERGPLRFADAFLPRAPEELFKRTSRPLWTATLTC